MYTYILFLLIIIVIVIARSYLNKNKAISPKREYHFTKKTKIMTEAEARFFNVLSQTVGDRFFILPQAHLSTFIEHKVKGQNWKAAFGMINGKSVDFLLVEKNSLRPAAAIELDDWSHSMNDRVQRDEKVQAMLEEAGVILVRFSNPDVDRQTIIDSFQKIVSQSLEIQK